jgi:hypothetical protein
MICSKNSTALRTRRASSQIDRRRAGLSAVHRRTVRAARSGMKTFPGNM